MKIEHYTQTATRVAEEAEGVSLRWVIDRSDGAPTFAMRVIEVEPGSNTPFHTHRWKHGVFVLDGRGMVRSQDGETPIEPETVVFVPPGEQHGFFNTGDEVLRFICVVPLPED